MQEICLLAEEAGVRAMRFYRGRASVAFKKDSSPLTDADRASHDFLIRFLPALIPGVPVISEESQDPTLGLNDGNGRFWLVDPLDGTKEFLKGTGEFTVNIALVEQGRPVIGVVHAPALGVVYFAELEGGAFRRSHKEAPVPVRAQRLNRGPIRVVASKDHPGPLIAGMLARLPGAELKSMGSSLKFCLVAEGNADIYLRDLPTMEWDTAAAQCIVEAAGGRVCTLDGKPLRYGKPGLKNPAIITVADPDLPWKTFLDGNPQIRHDTHQKSDHIYRTPGQVTTQQREVRNGHAGCVLWLTGLSASGKSTIAAELERQLFNRGSQVCVLDGDNVRHGLCSDLGFTQEDRTENIRRIGEVAKLLAGNGIICITAFISPYRADRDLVRKIMPEGRFIEVYINAPIEVCEARDPKGLYAKARSNEIKNFTGISAPYEPPEHPEVELRTDLLGSGECVDCILEYLDRFAESWRSIQGKSQIASATKHQP